MSKCYTIKTRLLCCYYWIVMLTIPVLSPAQGLLYANAEKRFQQSATKEQFKPLSEVLNELQERYQVSFLYESASVEGKKVPMPIEYKGKMENTLSHLLDAAGLTYKRINQKTYSILPKQISKPVRKNDPQAYLSKGITESLHANRTSAEDALFERYLRPREILVSGTITDETDNPLPGVNVLIKGSTVGTTTDVSGRFSLNVPDENAVLVISFIGYTTQEILVGNRTHINVRLAPDIQQLSEVVVVGYGTQKRTSLTGAISSVSSDELSVQPVINVSQALQGRVAGVTVVNNGAPGSAPIVRVRGVGTINRADPLYVVDGFPTGDLNSFNVKDIESIEVLKDASAAAIYGSRASNGVILITTKRGSNKKLSVNLDSYYGVEQPWKKLDLLNTEQYISYANDLMTNADIQKGDAPGTSIPTRIKSGLDQPVYPGATRTFRQTNTNWQDEMFRTAPIQQHKAEVSGGTDQSRMFASFGYFEQEGVMRGTGYQRGDVRFNSDHNINKRISFGQNFYAAFDETLIEQQAGGRTQVQHMIRNTPYLPVHNPHNYGGFMGAQGVDGSDPENPVRIADMDKQNQQRLKLLANAFVNIDLFDFLSYRFQAGVDYVNTTQRVHLPAYNTGTGGYASRPDARVNQNRQEFISPIITNQLVFNKTFDKHTINATLVAEQQTSRFTQITGQGDNPISNDVKEPVALDNQTYNGNRVDVAILSYIARVNYDFGNKYLLGASIRRDGSSRFAPGEKWGTFPAVSVGWRMSEEAFLAGNNVISDLKLRASYGVTGNNNIGDYRYLATLSGNQIYQFDRTGSIASGGYTLRTLANPELKWETTYMTNVGVDFGFLNNSITLTAEYFNNETRDMLVERPIPLSTGYDFRPFANVGKVRNRGFELQVGYNKTISDFTFGISGNLSVVRNKVLDLGEEGTTLASGEWYGDNLTLTKVGEPIGYFNGFIMDGIFQNQGEVDAHGVQPDARPGDIRFRDVSGPDGVPDGVLNSFDKVNIGHFLPDFAYGINLTAGWKNFDVAMFLQGVSGNEIYSVVKYDLEGMTRLFNSGTAVLNRWTAEGQSTNVPRAVNADPNLNARSSTRFIEDGSYFRIKNLTLGYTLPQSTLASLTRNALTRARLYFTSQNLLTLTKYKSGYDPEIGNRNANVAGQGGLTQGIDMGQYPQARSLILGLQIGF